MLIDVMSVVPHPDFTLELEYANGERRRFDATQLLAVRPWTALAVWPLFRRVRVEHGTVTWPGDLDIAPETLYDCSKPIESELKEVRIDAITE
jgi:hypothetical protein